MNDFLSQLEAQKADLLRQFAAVGDLPRGSITATSGKCGKPNCHCAKRGDPGHDPNFRLTRRVAGKTTPETFDSQAALRKAQQEVALWSKRLTGKKFFRKVVLRYADAGDWICQKRLPRCS